MPPPFTTSAAATMAPTIRVSRPVTGYDLATGIGSPVANVLVPALVSTTLYSANMNTNPGWTFTSGRASGPLARRAAAAASQLGIYGVNVVGYNLSGDLRQADIDLLGNHAGDQLYGLHRRDARFLALAGRREILHAPRLHRGFQQRDELDHRLAEFQQHQWTRRGRREPTTFRPWPTISPRFTSAGAWGRRPHGTYCGWNIDDVTVMGCDRTSFRRPSRA